jgi:hypothetical protein
MYYIVRIPQEDYAFSILTAEERDSYIRKLEEYDEDLTVDYSDDSLPFYNLDRKIDGFTVKEAINYLKVAEEIRDEDIGKYGKGTLAGWARKLLEDNKWWFDRWLEDFEEVYNNLMTDDD